MNKEFTRGDFDHLRNILERTDCRKFDGLKVGNVIVVVRFDERSAPIDGYIGVVAALRDDSRQGHPVIGPSRNSSVLRIDFLEQEVSEVHGNVVINRNLYYRYPETKPETKEVEKLLGFDPS